MTTCLVRYAIIPPSKKSRDTSKNRSNPVTERKKPPWPGDLVVSPVSAVSTAPMGVTTRENCKYQGRRNRSGWSGFGRTTFLRSSISLTHAYNLLFKARVIDLRSGFCKKLIVPMASISSSKEKSLHVLTPQFHAESCFLTAQTTKRKKIPRASREVTDSHCAASISLTTLQLPLSINIHTHIQPLILSLRI